jgi:hypothetical protein
MRTLRTFGGFWYDFVIGDDWRVALAVVAALGVTLTLNRVAEVAPWWILVVAVVVALPVSIARVARKKT